MTPYVLVVAVCVVAALAVVSADGARRPDKISAARPVTIAGPYALRIVDARDKARRCQARLGLERSPVSTKPVLGREYARWVLALWKGRAQAYCTLARELGHPVGAIRAVFGPHADEAISVARCESGDREGELSPHVVYASNGQYQGMFQMGSSERARYGHGITPLEQARAAHAYFVASGRDWSPWQCRPGGHLAW